MVLQAAQMLVTPYNLRDESFMVKLRETTEQVLRKNRAQSIPVFVEDTAGPCSLYAQVQSSDNS